MALRANIKGGKSFDELLVLARIAKGERVPNAEIIKTLVQNGYRERSAPTFASRTTRFLKELDLIESYRLEPTTIAFSITEKGREELHTQATEYIKNLEAIIELLRPFQKTS